MSKTNPKNNFIQIFLIINLSFCLTISNSNKDSLHKNSKRILQKREYSSNSIYYETIFTQNNITGTGDKLKDVPYRSFCLVKNCISGCCEGDINLMICGTDITCGAYKDHENYLVVAPAVLIPVCILIFLTIFVLIFTKRNEYSFSKSLLLAVICLGIITIPFVLYYARDAPSKKKSNLKQEEKK